jgi:signal transduction histidine kinase/CheY-like chemotaxis protein
VIAIVAAVALLAAGLLAAEFNEQSFRRQSLQEARAQAGILSASVTAALAFNDDRAAAEYLAALRANPQIEAAGVYDLSGRLAADYRRDPGADLPRRLSPKETPDSRASLAVVAPVAQGSATLGCVYLRIQAEPLARRAVRYASIGVLGIMAALVVLVLAFAQAALRRTNRALVDTNRTLEQQIAQRERAEEALRQSQKMEAMGQLTGGVAHDFNNLLMVASSGLDLLDRTQDPVRRELLKQGIRQAVDRGAALTRQLLAFARRSPLKAEVIDLGHQIRQMRVMLERSLREDIEVKLDLADGLWPIEVDVGQLEVAVLNIAVNARDAMPEGGTITVGAANRPGLLDGALCGDFVELWLKDTGRGMEQETLHRAFEPFFTTKAIGKGTGLGLSQVYGFIRASGGDVRVQSALGQGATLRLYFPRTSKAMRPPDPSSPAPAQRSRRRDLVLLVEDDDAVAAAVIGLLEEIGYQVRRESTAASALKSLDEGQPADIVFSDMVMPGAMDGITLARALRQRFPRLPVVLTTGFSDAADAAVREGMRLLAKPYSMADLARELAAAQAERLKPIGSEFQATLRAADGGLGT